MNYTEDGRAWLSLAANEIADAQKALVYGLRHVDEPDGEEYAKQILAALDRARADALRALVYFQMAKDEDAR